MKKSNKDSQWDQAWASAFEDASLKPSERVWESIDGALANQEICKYKKRAFFYKYMAAACFLLACCSIAFVLLQGSFQEQSLAEEANSASDMVTQNKEAAPLTQLAETAETAEKAPENSAVEAENSASENYTAGEKRAEQPSGSNKNQQAENAGIANKNTEDSQAVYGQSYASLDHSASSNKGNQQPKATHNSRQQAAVLPSSDGENDGEKPTSSQPVLSEFGSAVEKGLADLKGLKKVKGMAFIEEQSNNSVTANVHKVWMPTEMFKKFKQEDSPRYLVGANIASNFFNPNFQSSGLENSTAQPVAGKPTKGVQDFAARTNNWSENPETQNQPSINASLQAAGWIGKKWVLQGGVQYGNYSSSTEAGSYLDAGTAQTYPLHYANFSADKVQRGRVGSRMTAPVSAINTFEFISVPVRIGYLVLDKKIGLLVSPGISSEFFLKNTLSDENKQLSSYTVYGGEDAPFNRVHFRATMGAQVFYKLSEHYMITLEPNYQHAITDFNKEGTMFNSRPSNMGLSAGFRYIIR